MPGGTHPPLSVILSWPKPNYVDPQTRGWELVAVTSTLYTIALVTVGARMWARFVLLKNAGLDDALIVLSLVLALGMSISICLASKLYGFDRHVWDIYIPELVQTRQITFVIVLLYILSTALTRLSILCFYRRMAKGTFSTKFIWSVRITMAFVIAHAIVFGSTLIFGCSPIEAAWRQVDYPWLSDHTYHCIDEGASFLAGSSFGLVADLLTCLLPMLLFWKLRLPRRQKLALGAIFGLGGFLCVTAILRIYYMHHIYYETYDTTWAANNSWMWTSVEVNVGILCASAPALKAFFHHHLGGSTPGPAPYGSPKYRSSSAVPFNKRSGDRDVEASAGTFGSTRALKLEDSEPPIEMSSRYHQHLRSEQRKAGFNQTESVQVPVRFAM